MTMTIEDAIDNEIVVTFHFLKAYYRKYYKNTHFKPIKQADVDDSLIVRGPTIVGQRCL